MVRQWRHGSRELSLEFPGGVIEKGEDVLAAARAAIGGEVLTVDEAGVPVVPVEPELHRQWAEIERRAEDRGVSPHVELVKLAATNAPLARYGLLHLRRRLELMSRSRDAVRGRLMGLSVIEIESRAVSESVRALEVAIARKVDFAGLSDVKKFREWHTKARQTVACKTVVALAAGADSNVPKRTKRRIKRRILKERLTDAAELARAAMEVIRDDIPSLREPLSVACIADSLTAFDGAACGIGLASLGKYPFTNNLPPPERLEEPPDWKPIEISLNDRYRTEVLLMCRYKTYTIETATTPGLAALALTALMQIHEEVSKGKSNDVKSYLLYWVDPGCHERFAELVGRLLLAADSGAVPLYKEVSDAIRAAAKVLSKADGQIEGE
jgi:hypothetical protein